MTADSHETTDLIAVCHELGLRLPRPVTVYSNRPGCVLVAEPYGSPGLNTLTERGFDVCPSGRHHAIVSPPYAYRNLRGETVADGDAWTP